MIKRYLGRKEEQVALQLMEWPPESPDLNIIEYVWDHLDGEKVQKHPKSVEELRKVLKNAWKTIFFKEQMFFKDCKTAFQNE